MDDWARAGPSRSLHPALQWGKAWVAIQACVNVILEWPDNPPAHLLRHTSMMCLCLLLQFVREVKDLGLSSDGGLELAEVVGGGGFGLVFKGGCAAGARCLQQQRGTTSFYCIHACCQCMYCLYVARTAESPRAACCTVWAAMRDLPCTCRVVERLAGRGQTNPDPAGSRSQGGC